MNLDEICQLWRYQNTECRMTELLKEKIDGYDNNNPFSLNRATKEREKWLEEKKFMKTNEHDLLEKTKEEYLHDMLHPEEIYL